MTTNNSSPKNDRFHLFAHRRHAASSALAAILLAACGGGGSDSPSASSSTGTPPITTPTPTTPTEPTSVSGSVAKGPIVSGTIEACPIINRVRSTSCLASVSDTTAQYRLNLPPGTWMLSVLPTANAVTQDEATQKSLPLPNDFRMRAVMVVAPGAAPSYRANITPISEIATTLIEREGSYSPQVISEIQTGLVNLFGVNAYDTTFVSALDPNVGSQSESTRQLAYILAVISEAAKANVFGCGGAEAARITCTVKTLANSIQYDAVARKVSYTPGTKVYEKLNEIAVVAQVDTKYRFVVGTETGAGSTNPVMTSSFAPTTQATGASTQLQSSYQTWLSSFGKTLENSEARRFLENAMVVAYETLWHEPSEHVNEQFRILAEAGIKAGKEGRLKDYFANDFPQLTWNWLAAGVGAGGKPFEFGSAYHVVAQASCRTFAPDECQEQEAIAQALVFVQGVVTLKKAIGDPTALKRFKESANLWWQSEWGSALWAKGNSRFRNGVRRFVGMALEGGAFGDDVAELRQALIEVMGVAVADELLGVQVGSLGHPPRVTELTLSTVNGVLHGSFNVTDEDGDRIMRLRAHVSRSSGASNCFVDVGATYSDTQAPGFKTFASDTSQGCKDYITSSGTYYVKIEAYDVRGNKAGFEPTGVFVTVPNRKPLVSNFSVNANGAAIAGSFYVTDPDNDAVTDVRVHVSRYDGGSDCWVDVGGEYGRAQSAGWKNFDTQSTSACRNLIRSSGTYYVKVETRDTNGAQAEVASLPVNVFVPNNKPVVRNLSLSSDGMNIRGSFVVEDSDGDSITGLRAHVSRTDGGSDCYIDIGAGYNGLQTSGSKSFNSDASAGCRSYINMSATYFVKIEAHDTAGNQAVVQRDSVTVGGGNQRPVVSNLNAFSVSTGVSGSFTVDDPDNDLIQRLRVHFSRSTTSEECYIDVGTWYLNYQQEGSKTFSSFPSCSWYFTRYGAGLYSVKVEAYDSQGNKAAVVPFQFFY